MISVAPAVPPVSVHQCHLSLPISALVPSMPVPHQCHISVPTSAHQCHLSVLISDPFQCYLSMPVSAAYQCCQSVLPIS
ncbi:unnamed protein product, partial [Staurois parvus]